MIEIQIKRAARSAGYALSTLSKAYWAALPEKAEAEAASRAREEAVRELESITGLFKGKQRRAAQERSAAAERLRVVEDRLTDPQ